MGKIDKIKESIGYLKVIFSILVAIDVSLVAWVFKNSNTIEDSQMLNLNFEIVTILCYNCRINNASINIYKQDHLR